jgi:hypothetical protein
MLKDIYAVFLMVNSLKLFNPRKEFLNKRIAVLGAADTLYDDRNGDYIDQFDIVVRINKAAITWKPENAAYVGKKMTFLYHSFYENEFSGGGVMDWDLFGKYGIRKVINPNFTFKGLRAHFNFYKRHLKPYKTYIIIPSSSKKSRSYLNGHIPTIGFSALSSILESNCKEVYISGFTFFKSSYHKDYREELSDQETNLQHIKDQGIHNPEKEYLAFKKILSESKCENIKLDNGLKELFK